MPIGTSFLISWLIDEYACKLEEFDHNLCSK